MEEEIWKDVIGHPGYQVSNLGRVKSLCRKIVRSDGFVKTINERILSPRINNVGYKYVNLLLNGKAKSKTVHRLVAIAFIPNTDNKSCIDHINGMRTDNRAENLRWCTHKENQNFPIAAKRREKSYTPVRQWAFDGTLIKTFQSTACAAKELNIPHSNITACCTGRRKNAGGFIWTYTSSAAVPIL